MVDYTVIKVFLFLRIHLVIDGEERSNVLLEFRVVWANVNDLTCLLKLSGEFFPDRFRESVCGSCTPFYYKRPGTYSKHIFRHLSTDTPSFFRTQGNASCRRTSKYVQTDCGESLWIPEAFVRG